MWISSTHNVKYLSIKYVYPSVFGRIQNELCKQKYPQSKVSNFHLKNVDIVDNYSFKRFSPMFTTSPAPIVINKSPGE